jgi:glycerol-3-phosphate acyltransferase PlsX
MKIAIDAMGGDHAPQEVVKGAVLGARETGLGVYLVGQQDKIKAELAKLDTAGLDIEIIHTDEYLVEGEQPAYALRTKRNASIALAVKLVKEGKAQAAYSAGTTGGVIAAALGYLGMMEGISRPVIGGPFIGFAPKTVIMDVGGNVDVRPDQLLDFAIVGAVYANKIMDIPNPSVAVLSVGAEEGKGNEQVKSAWPLFKKSGLNFVGNAEGYDLVTGKVNVIVCDGFVGNILVKFYEALGRVEARWLEKMLSGKIAAQDLQSVIAGLMKMTNVADAMGGGPIWAVNGLVIKAHGRAMAEEFGRGMAVARSFIEKEVVETLKKEMAVVRTRLNVTEV